MPIGTIDVPPTHVNDAPHQSICVNVEWIPAIIAMINPAKYPEFWAGTLDENRRARREIQNLLYLISTAEECDMSICCEPAIYIYRQNPDTGRAERSSDFGTSWTPDPADPVYHTTQQIPPVTSGVSSTKCDAATNFSEHFNELI